MQVRPVVLTVLMVATLLSADDLKPGKDRWKVKTTVESAQAKKKPVKKDLADLLTFDAPDKTKYDYIVFDRERKVETGRMRGKDSHRPQEGDVVYTEGYVQMVMLSADDGDYHVQLTTDPKKRADCMIVEVPYEKFVDDPGLPDEGTIRQTLRTKLKPKSGEFSKSGTCMLHPPRMGVTGQLFYDVHHDGKPSGRHGCHAPNVWELHPVFKIKFLDPLGTSPYVGKCPEK
jgi:hypothetical protein